MPVSNTVDDIISKSAANIIYKVTQMKVNNQSDAHDLTSNRQYSYGILDITAVTSAIQYLTEQHHVLGWTSIQSHSMILMQ